MMKRKRWILLDVQIFPYLIRWRKILFLFIYQSFLCIIVLHRLWNRLEILHTPVLQRPSDRYWSSYLTINTSGNLQSHSECPPLIAHCIQLCDKIWRTANQGLELWWPVSGLLPSVCQPSVIHKQMARCL